MEAAADSCLKAVSTIHSTGAKNNSPTTQVNAVRRIAFRLRLDAADDELGAGGGFGAGVCGTVSTFVAIA
ncbi:hypothetical protein GCM10027562_38570 [Arthrobacter pigmenti]